MRQSKRMGKMKDERVRKLDDLGFLWRCEQTGKVIWEEMIDKLKAFQAHHGHCRYHLFPPLHLLAREKKKGKEERNEEFF
jgi:hypothetical protein